jgi:hypothetical protein
LVAAELSRRGYVASLTLGNTPGIDILASDARAEKTVGIQVKTNQGSGTSWMLSKKDEEPRGHNLFYVFVNLNRLDRPEFYVVPRETVARQIRENHKRWLRTPGRGGRPHRDTTIRRFTDPEKKYRDRWELLGLGAPAV